MSTAPRTRPSARAHDRVRHRVAGAVATRGRGEHRGHHPAGPVHHRSARVPVAHKAAQRRDRALHGPAPVGVLGDHGRGLPESRRLHVVRAVLGEAEDRGRGARLRVHVERQRRRASNPGHAQDREVVLRVVPDGLGVQRRAVAAELDRRVVLARDHVSVRHDDPAAGDPAAPLDAQAAGGAEHAHHAPPGRPHVGVAGDLRVRRRHVRGRAADGRERVEARERLAGSAPTAAAPRSASGGSLSAGSARAARARRASGAPPRPRSTPGRARGRPPAPRRPRRPPRRAPRAAGPSDGSRPPRARRRIARRASAPRAGPRAARRASGSRRSGAPAPAATRGTRPERSRRAPGRRRSGPG